MHEINVRRIREEDIEDVITLIHQNWDEVLTEYHSPEFIAKFRGAVKPETIKKEMPIREIYVAERDGRVIATGSFANFGNADKPRHSVSRFFVRTSAHRRGVGTAMMRHLMQIAKRKGVSVLHVPSTRNAIGFYRSLGFTTDDVQPPLDDEITWMSMELSQVALYMERRPATDRDLDLLAEWNHQLICDEGHRSQMALPELRERMRGWLGGEYEAVIFLVDGQPSAYALYRDNGEDVYLRQLFVARDRRQQGIGRKAVEILRNQVWPAPKRLTVDVLTTNTAGVRFWRAVGFSDYCLTLEVIPRREDVEQLNAADLFRDGCACSQAILAVYGQPLGLSRDLAMRIAAGFAGGMRMAETCGAVTGALMVLGLRHASANCETPAGRKTAYDRTVEFIDRFKARHGSVVCRELLGCDISTPEGMKEAERRNLFKTTCVKMVEDAAAILEEMAEKWRVT